jgi:hypothetical protein
VGTSAPGGGRCRAQPKRYFPYLVASAGAGYEHAFIPFPKLNQGPGPTECQLQTGGTLATDAVGERATLGVKWLLFDFGERKAVPRWQRKD